MADPIVGITNGVPTSGTGTITTLGQTLVDGANATLGANADAASATGSMSAKLRALVTALGTTVWTFGAGAVGATSPRITLASDDPLVAAFGTKADAKNAATDTTPVSGISALKQISASVQLLAGTGTATDRSGTITSGATAQNAMASNAVRKGWVLINNSDTDMYVHAAGTASSTAGIPVYPREMAFGYEVNAISVYCVTTGKAFTAWEYS